jgi:hypothetical protein
LIVVLIVGCGLQEAGHEQAISGEVDGG